MSFKRYCVIDWIFFVVVSRRRTKKKTARLARTRHIIHKLQLEPNIGSDHDKSDQYIAKRVRSPFESKVGVIQTLISISVTKTQNAGCVLDCKEQKKKKNWIEIVYNVPKIFIYMLCVLSTHWWPCNYLYLFLVVYLEGWDVPWVIYKVWQNKKLVTRGDSLKSWSRWDNPLQF